MTMEKLGVRPEILHTELRNEEARLMQKMQSYLTDGTKTASEKSQLEQELQAIRQRIGEADGAFGSEV